MTEQAAWQCENLAVHDDLGNSRKFETSTTLPTTTDDDMVLMLRPAEFAHTTTPLTATCRF